MRKWLLGLGFLALMGAPAVEAQSGSSAAFYLRLCKSSDPMDSFACDQLFLGFYAGLQAAAIETRQFPYCGLANAGQLRGAFFEMADGAGAEMLKADITPFLLAAVSRKFTC